MSYFDNFLNINSSMYNIYLFSYKGILNVF